MKGLSEFAMGVARDIDEQAEKAEREFQTRFADAHPGQWVGSGAQSAWKSSIVGGDELIAGQTYRLERTTANAPEGFKLGKTYVALGNSEGEFTGEVIDREYRSYIVDEKDLFLTA